MATIDLIYDADCPNVAKTRANLLAACAELRLAPRWLERDAADAAASPAWVRFADAVGQWLGHCRGRTDTGRFGVPSVSRSGRQDGGRSPVELIVVALRAHGAVAVSAVTNPRTAWRDSLATLPGIGAALLPVGTCPACFAAYAGVLSALGVGTLLQVGYLLPVTVLALIAALAALAYRAKARRGFGPLLLGALGSGLIVAGKFLFAADPAWYGGAALLVAASVWNGWPVKRQSVGSCPACVPGTALSANARDMFAERQKSS